MRLHLACDNDIHPPLFGATQRLFGLARGAASRAAVRARTASRRARRAAVSLAIAASTCDRETEGAFRSLATTLPTDKTRKTPTANSADFNRKKPPPVNSLAIRWF